MLVRLFIHPFNPDFHGLLKPLSVAPKLFRADIVIVDSRFAQYFLHRIHHRGWAVDVVDGERQIINGFQEHSFTDKPSFPMPLAAGLFHLCHCADKGIVWICVVGFHQFIQEYRIFRPSIGIEDKDSVRNLVVNRLKNNAPHRCNANTTGEEYGWNIHIVVKRERAMRSVQCEFRARLHGF